jgi:hypothetical protein
MGLEFLRRVHRSSILSALLLFAVITTYAGFPAGLATVVGCGWSLVNLLLIGYFVKTLMDRSSKVRMVLIALVKVPVLYGFGFLLLKVNYLPAEFLLVGFMWPLVVITLKAMGRLILKLDAARGTPR